MKKVKINFSEDALEDIKRLANDSNMTPAIFIRNAIRVYGAIKKETKNCKKIFVGTDWGVDKEIIIP